VTSLLFATILGPPVPFARPRFVRGRVFQEPRYAAWRERAALAVRAALTVAPNTSRGRRATAIAIAACLPRRTVHTILHRLRIERRAAYRVHPANGSGTWWAL
jgi:hypothetical protein